MPGQSSNRLPGEKEMIQAYRIEKFEDLDDTKFCYFKSEGIWYLYMPGCGLGNLANHKIVEHEDGTITRFREAGRKTRVS